MLTKEQANEALMDLIKAAEYSIQQATELADKYGLQFSFAVAGNYALQDDYVGMALDKEYDATRQWKRWETKYDTMEELEASYNGWQSSSANC